MFLSVLERVNIAMRGLNLEITVVACRELGERGTKLKVFGMQSGKHDMKEMDFYGIN